MPKECLPYPVADMTYCDVCGRHWDYGDWEEKLCPTYLAGNEPDRNRRMAKYIGEGTFHIRNGRIGVIEDVDDTDDIVIARFRRHDGNVDGPYIMNKGEFLDIKPYNPLDEFDDETPFPWLAVGFVASILLLCVGGVFAIKWVIDRIYG